MRYTKTDDYIFNIERKPYKENTQSVGIHSTLSGENNKIDLERGTPVTDWWTDIQTVTGWNPEKQGYPTQKPLGLLKRIILASSNEGDMVLDPFCGCATTCEAADNYGRQWVGIDISPEAARLVQKRIESDVFRQNFKQYDTLPILTDRKPSKPYNHPDNIFAMIGRQLSYCFLCFKKKDIEDLCVDHIVAKSRGGSDFLDNLQMVCHKCNSAKGNKTNEEALAEQWKKDGVEWERRKFEVEQKILVALKKKSKLEIM